MSFTFDTGALIALERRDAKLLALLDLVGRAQQQVLIPAGVVAQALRSPRQARLAQFLKSTNVRVVPLDEGAARAVGLLLGVRGTTDTVDGHVVLVGRSSGSVVVTSDPDDLHRLDERLSLQVI